jgi:hypothetical protein
VRWKGRRPCNQVATEVRWTHNFSLNCSSLSRNTGTSGRPLLEATAPPGKRTAGHFATWATSCSVAQCPYAAQPTPRETRAPRHRAGGRAAESGAVCCWRGERSRGGRFHVSPLRYITECREMPAARHPDWRFEIKHDGFPGVACVKNGAA